MVDLFDNKTKLLGDDLILEIDKHSKIKIAASYFSIYAFEALKKELESIDELKFIFTSPTFLKDKITDKIKKESREFFIPKQFRESNLYGTDFELKLRNQLTQKAIARECAEWIKNKVRFKSVKSESVMPNFLNIEKQDKSNIVYSNIKGFTSEDLGYEKSDTFFSAILKTDIPEQTKYFVNQFNQVWKDNSVMDDVTEAIVDYISTCYKENSPEFIYFVVLYNIFSEFLEDLSEDSLPNEATGYKNSLIWQKLYNFQKDGVIGIINKLEKYNGCILADSVGLGKTFTALGVMQYYSLKNKSILVLCPKRLANNWNSYRGNTKTNIFFDDKIRYDVLYHTDLSRKSGFSNGLNLATINWGNYDLVVIDESHNFRNNNIHNKAKENRYDFLMNHIMKDGVNTKVLMLSATPVNNRYNDLKNQLALAYCGNFSKLNDQLDTEKSVDSIFRTAQKAFNKWSKLPLEQRHAKDLLDELDIDFSILLDSVTIARSRKHIQKYYDTKDIGTFPKRKETMSLSVKLNEDENQVTYKILYDLLDQMTMNVYAPLGKLFPSKRSLYEQQYGAKFSSGNASNLGSAFQMEQSRENGTKKLMMIMVLKRLESSIYAFNITVSKLIETHKKALSAIADYENGNIDAYIDKDFNTEYAVYDPDEDGSFAMAKTGNDLKIKVKMADIDTRSWKREIEADLAVLKEIYFRTENLTAENDSKLMRLKELIADKLENPINVGNKKILIFSAFADTADYLYKNLQGVMLSKHGMHTAKVVGGNSNNQVTDGRHTDTDRILTYFSPLSKEKAKIYPEDNDTIDVLIATDCISEGQNLQDCDICINYDIHWNPVRIVQRFGRIDRIGSKNEYIQLVNFWPDIALDKYINLNKRVNARMTIVNATATADDNILSNEDEELDYRAEQLKKLQQGELQDLEDVDGSITITDLGLNEFRMDMAKYLKEHGEPRNLVKGLHAVIKADQEKGVVPGVIFVLRNKNEGVNIEKQNRLHPYYLVYITEDGKLVYNHLQVKNILDVMRSGCKYQDKPIKEVCDQFNKETKDGYRMDKYNDLLEDAILTIIDTNEQSDIDSLFSEGGTTALLNEVQGFDEFELIAFVVVK